MCRIFNQKKCGKSKQAQQRRVAQWMASQWCQLYINLWNCVDVLIIDHECLRFGIAASRRWTLPYYQLLLISSHLTPLFSGLSIPVLTAIERSCWWLHIVGIFVFMNYLPYSKHLHVILAFPNAYYAKLSSTGKMPNMKEIQQEVLYMMQRISPCQCRCKSCIEIWCKRCTRP